MISDELESPQAVMLLSKWIKRKNTREGDEVHSPRNVSCFYGLVCNGDSSVQFT